MFNSKKLTGILLFTLVVSGCSNHNETNGQIVGGVTGAVIGSQFGKGNGKVVGATIGAIAGSIIGGQIGSQLDEQDKKAQENAFVRATSAPIGTKIHWHNRHSSYRGSVTPIQEGYNELGHYCRGIKHSVFIEDRVYHDYDSVCQFEDKTWYIVE